MQRMLLLDGFQSRLPFACGVSLKEVSAYANQHIRG